MVRKEVAISMNLQPQANLATKSHFSLLRGVFLKRRFGWIRRLFLKKMMLHLHHLLFFNSLLCCSLLILLLFIWSTRTLKLHVSLIKSAWRCLLLELRRWWWRSCWRRWYWHFSSCKRKMHQNEWQRNECLCSWIGYKTRCTCKQLYTKQTSRRMQV